MYQGKNSLCYPYRPGLDDHHRQYCRNKQVRERTNKELSDPLPLLAWASSSSDFQIMAINDETLIDRSQP